MAISLSCPFRPPAPRPCASRGASAHGHTRGVVLSTRARWLPPPQPCPSARPPRQPACGAGSAGHAERKLGEPPWLCGLQIFIPGLGCLPLLVGRIWILRPCWAIRLMAFLLRSDNLVNSTVRFLMTLHQVHSAKITRSPACPRRGAVGVGQGCTGVPGAPESGGRHPLPYRPLDTLTGAVSGVAVGQSLPIPGGRRVPPREGPIFFWD